MTEESVAEPSTFDSPEPSADPKSQDVTASTRAFEFAEPTSFKDRRSHDPAGAPNSADDTTGDQSAKRASQSNLKSQVEATASSKETEGADTPASVPARPRTIKSILCIGGSDSSAGAGLQADLKTIHQHGMFGSTVVTLLTAQNTLGVTAVKAVDPEFIRAQFFAVVADIPPAAVKVGALGNVAAIETVVELLAELKIPIVVDPVMISKSGDKLMDDDAVESLRSKLLKSATMVTPNRFEANALTGIKVTDLGTAQQASRRLIGLGAKSAVIKNCRPDGASAVDWFWEENRGSELSRPKVDSKASHGTGCVFAAALACRLAEGLKPLDAARKAKEFVIAAIASAQPIGAGNHPVDFFIRPT
jgi:hydroxymethylpyrimidine/phosphomethylpyrimidine kinase